MITPGDLDIAARTLWAEARGEPYEGKKAVVHVLLNRWHRREGDADHSLAATCLRWRQFSGWNEGDPNRAKVERVGLEDSAFRECLRAVLEALDEPDFTKGSRHYHTAAVSPAWSRGHEPVLRLGGHLFFNDVA